MNKPILVGESNPYNSPPEYALWPEPAGCSGQRLCQLILGMTPTAYLACFERVNLCAGPWSLRTARLRAAELWAQPGRFILCGAKVALAWQTPFVPFTVSDGGTVLVIPHPSGLNRSWCRARYLETRAAVAAFAPEVAPFLGVTDREAVS